MGKATRDASKHSAPSTPVETTESCTSIVDDTLSDRAKWQLAYGFRDVVDLVYEKHTPPQKPRLPRATDSTDAWRYAVLPESANELLGNPHAVDLLHAIQCGTQSIKSNFIISGGDGTGKRSFLRLLKRVLPDAPALETPCVFHSFDAKKAHDRDLVSMMEDAVRKVDSEKTTAFLIIENLEAVSIAVQQHYLLPFVALCNAKNNIFAVLVMRPDATKLPEQLRQRAGQIHLKPLDERDVRIKLLQICAIQKVGYERDGIEELLKFCRFDLLSSIATLQQLFVSFHFLSLANVRRSFSSAAMKKRNSCVVAQQSTRSTTATPPPFPLSILSMNEPLRRCKLCTLLPPCSHISMQHLYDRVGRIRELYPPRDDEQETSTCPSYAKRGICTNIQSIGRCRYAHPRGLHVVDTRALVARCKPHTLPVPCLHCDATKLHKQELHSEELIVQKILSQLAVDKKNLLDKENERYMFVRDQTKSIKWGAARQEYEHKLELLDATLDRMRQGVATQLQEVETRSRRIDQLRDDVTRGRSKGMGKGHGKVLVPTSSISTGSSVSQSA